MDSSNCIDKLAKNHSSAETLSEAEQLLVLQVYSPIGDKNKWIDWVLQSRKKNLCPYR